MDDENSGFRPISPDLADPTIAARQRAAEMEELKKSSKLFANNLAKMDQSDSSNGFSNFTSTNQKAESKKDTISSIREAAEQRRIAQQYQTESGIGWN